MEATASEDEDTCFGPVFKRKRTRGGGESAPRSDPGSPPTAELLAFLQ